MAGPYPHLAEPIQVGALRLKNRFVMGSMHSGLEGHPDRFDSLARFYAERAKGGAGLIITGGFSPNHAGRVKDHPCTLDSEETLPAHRKITEAVHREGGRILLQLLHAGRYGYHADIVAPSPIQSPINRESPAELSEAEILRTIDDYARSARLALAAGYDGVEIMGSEGYLISQFLALRTNHRGDDWGGDLEARARFPLEVVRATRQALGPGGLMSYRISALDLVEGGLGQEETLWLAQAVEAAGADCFVTGIGWHESAVPTIAGAVPQAAFAGAAAKIKQVTSIPVIVSNRINLPETAERLIREGQADMVSMARPFLSDPEIANKALTGKSQLISVCIACNQACLDHYFTDQAISCLLNPRAARELDYRDDAAEATKAVAVVGAGVAGIACALEAARKGHRVTLYDAAEEIGGQFRLAAKVPGKRDYGLAIDAYDRQLEELGVKRQLGAAVDAETLLAGQYDEIVISTGVTPRPLDLPGAEDPRVVGYSDVLTGKVRAGERVLIIGGGGIGHDVALYLAHPNVPESEELEAFEEHWGIGRAREPQASPRKVTMLKRSPGRFGRTLGKSTGWVLRQELRDFDVRQLSEVTYRKIDAAGLHITRENEPDVLPADTIVVCAGQESNRSLADQLMAKGCSVHVVGGARLAGELDAKRAIEEGAKLGNRL